MEKDTRLSASYLVAEYHSRNDPCRVSHLGLNMLLPEKENRQKLLHVRYCLPKSRTPREISWEIKKKKKQTDKKTKSLELFLNFILGVVPFFFFFFLTDCFGILLLPVSGERRVNFRFKTTGKKSDMGNT